MIYFQIKNTLKSNRYQTYNTYTKVAKLDFGFNVPHK